MNSSDDIVNMDLSRQVFLLTRYMTKR